MTHTKQSIYRVLVERDSGEILEFLRHLPSDEVAKGFGLGCMAVVQAESGYNEFPRYQVIKLGGAVSLVSTMRAEKKETKT